VVRHTKVITDRWKSCGSDTNLWHLLVKQLLSIREFFKTVLDRIASQTIAACAASVAPSIFMITRIYNQPSVSHSLWFPD
jgi:hypothetical protein